MNGKTMNSTFFRAEQQLKAAQRELLKSHDDTVPYMVCSNARKSIQSHLSGYLLTRGTELPPTSTVQTLVEKCKEFDSRFSDVGVEFMFCSHEINDSNFCTDIKKVEKCVEVASKIKGLVSQEHWPLSKPVK